MTTNLTTTIMTLGTETKQVMSRAQPPSRYICPLTLDLMNDPVLSIFGHSFERAAIFEWLTAGNEGCPLTRKPLRISHLISNVMLKREIDEWKQLHGYHTIPSEYLCPLSNVIMTHPLISRYGDNFERSAIYQWFDAGFNFCPITNHALTPSGLLPNIMLSQKIQKWKNEHPGSWDNTDDRMVELCAEDEAMARFRCFPSAAFQKPEKKNFRRISQRRSVAPAQHSNRKKFEDVYK
jgi:U-box domain